MSDNLGRLMAAGCFKKDAKLTPEEREVIQELSGEEVETLIKVRSKLGDKVVEKRGSRLTASTDDGSDLGIDPSFII